jgi:hypothetical protein
MDANIKINGSIKNGFGGKRKQDRNSLIMNGSSQKFNGIEHVSINKILKFEGKSIKNQLQKKLQKH